MFNIGLKRYALFFNVDNSEYTVEYSGFSMPDSEVISNIIDNIARDTCRKDIDIKLEKIA